MKIDATLAAGTVPANYNTAKTAEDQSFTAELAEATKKAKAANDDEKLKNACRDFEAMFLNLMYTKMRETVPDNSLYGTSHGEKIMQSMLDTELTKNMANSGGVGLAAMMYKQLSMQYNKVKQ